MICAGLMARLQQGPVHYNSVLRINTVTLADGSGAVFQVPPVAPACREPGGKLEELKKLTISTRRRIAPW